MPRKLGLRYSSSHLHSSFIWITTHLKWQATLILGVICILITFQLKGKPYRGFLIPDLGNGLSLERSCDIFIASFIAASKPSPPSPRRAGPKHSGRRMRSLTTTLAFSSTLSPDQIRVEEFMTMLTPTTNGKYHFNHFWMSLHSHHYRKQQSAGSQGNVPPPQGSSQCRGILYTPAYHNFVAHSQRDTALPTQTKTLWTTYRHVQ